MQIRPEQPADISQIEAVTTAAFKTQAYSAGTEAQIIAALREADELTLSLVAEEGPSVIGQITFSPVPIGGRAEGWFGLGPVAVTPDRHGQGIGGALIRAGLTALESQGAQGCVLIGDPNYYARFGFVGESGLTYRDVPTAYVQQRGLADSRRQVGEILYAPAFEATA